MAAVNGVGSHQESLKRRCDEKGGPCTSTPPLFTGFGGGARTTMAAPSTSKKLLSFSLLDDEGAAALAVIPPVTVVLEGRSICHRVRLHQHASYESLALALRRLFVDDADEEGRGAAGESRRGGLDLSNAVPGYVVAYEDAEDDLLLAGDLDWKDFVRVAKRIRVLPAKASRRRRRGGETP